MKHVDAAGFRELVRQWSEEAHLRFSDLHQPRSDRQNTLAIVVDGRGAPVQATAVTLSGILSSRVQRSPLKILLNELDDSAQLEEWLKDEQDVRFIRQLETSDFSESVLIICPAGVVSGVYSLEAVVDAMKHSDCQVLRAQIDGSRRSLEVWNTEVLKSNTPVEWAEARVREAGGERWVSGASLGLHYYDRPAPKLFLRKGAAGQFELNVVVRDLRDPEVRRDLLQEVKDLQDELRRFKSRQWRNSLEQLRRGNVKPAIDNSLRRVFHGLLRALKTLRQRAKDFS